jgi:hypothetical protein
VLHITTRKTIVANVAKVIKVVKVSKVIHSNAGENKITIPAMSYTILFSVSRNFCPFF